MCVHDPSITSRAAGFHDLRGQVGISPPRHGGASPEGVLIAKENAPRTPPQLLRCSRKPAASASMIYFVPCISISGRLRPARPEQTKSARSSRQFSRFCYAKNPDKVFGTHRIFDAHPPDQHAHLRVDLRSPSPWARLPTPVAAKAGSVPTHERHGPDDCENLQDCWKPAIQLDKEPAIPGRELDATTQPAPQNIQLMSKHRVLSFRPQLRLEWRG
jgi:hypothetical protein